MFQERLSRPFPHEKTASERLREMLRAQRGAEEGEEEEGGGARGRREEEEQLQLEREKQH